MNRIVDKIIHEHISSVSIWGIAKNAGKTTVLNALISAFPRSNCLGLVSIGVDGEKWDAWSQRPKPSIFVRELDYVATASKNLDHQPGDWKIVGFTGLHSVAGEVIIARALRDTNVTLSGVSTIEGVQSIINLYQRMDVQCTLIDGAYDRKTIASPKVSEAAIFVVGASYSNSLQKIIKKMEEWMLFLSLPVVEELTPQTLQFFFENRTPYCVIEGEIFPLEDMLKQGKIKQVMGENMIMVPGILTDRMLNTWLQQGINGNFIVLPDSTHLFISADTYLRCLRSGVVIKVMRSIRCLGFAMNPVSPDGHAYHPDEMKQKVEEVCYPYAVFDVVKEGGQIET